MDTQAFDRRRRTVLIASAAVATGALAAIGSCQKPQGMRRAPGEASTTDRTAVEPRSDRGEPQRPSDAESAAKPEGVEAVGACLAGIQGGQFQVTDAARERLARLP